MKTTPIKQLRLGDEVYVLGYEQYGLRRVVELYDQDEIPGGVKLDRAVGPDGEWGLFRSWNEDALLFVRRPA